MKSLVSMTGRPFLVLVVFALTVFSSKHEPNWTAGANSAPNSTKRTSRPSNGLSKEMISADAGFGPEAFWRGRDAAGLFLPSAVLMGCTTPSFASSVGSPFPAGANPHFAGVGLFNADNHLDVAVPDANSGLLTILLGNGSGGFSPAPGSPITVGSAPITAEVGDFNNDNKDDIAVTNQGSNSLTILLGNGDGTFTQAPGSPIAVGTAPRGVVKGLLNGDNNLDLAVMNGSSDSISILLGNGNGTFTNAPGSPMAGAFAPFHAVVGKFNGDAINDLAVANLGDGTVIIYLGNGNGSFTEAMQIPIVEPGTPISVGEFTSFIAVGLFNADANLDLAVTNRVDNNVVILLGNGNGGFTKAAGSPYGVGLAPMGVATADLNSDGKLDIAVSNENSANVAVLLGNGNGGFGSPFLFSTGHLPTHLAIADFNEDGRLDIMTPDGGDNTLTVLLNTCSSCPVLTVNPTTIPAGTTGTAYSQTFTATGGTAPYSFALTGTLPTGLSFTSPTLSGTPTQSGSFPITVTASDASGCMGTRNYTLVINCPSITVNPSTLPNGVAGTAYGQTVTATGGTAPYSFTVSAGALPAGLTLTSGGALTGTPTAAGTFNFTIKATDANGCIGTRGYTVVVTCPSITVNPTSLPNGVTGTAYSQTVTATGGTPPYTFTTSAGTLPTGLTLASGGALTGTPTAAGTFNFTIRATDANGCTGTRAFTVIISCPSITVNPATLPAGTFGTAYSQTFTTTGGTGPFSFALTGTLPTGMSFTSSTLSGTPTQTGSFPMTVTATDGTGCTGSTNYTLVINCPSIMVNPSTLPNGVAGTAYSQSVTATGGTAPYSFTVSAGALPTGLTLASGGALTGTPTAAGTYNFTVKATDANGCIGTRAHAVVVTCPSITVNPTSLPNGVTGTAYSQTVTATGGTAPYTFTITAGTQPTGLTLSSGGVLTGTPTAAGTFNFTVKATDANGCTGTRAYTVTVNCPSITLNPATIPAGAFSTVYSQTFTATGGTGPYSFALTGTLPTGMSFTSPTLSGTPTQSGSFPVTVTATDANSCTSSANYTLVINCPSITINPSTLPNGMAGTAYSQTVTASGGTAPYSFTVSAGTLPTGLMLASGGALTGTPTAAGTFNVTIKATDANGCVGTRAYTVIINCPSITVNPSSLPNGVFGTAYSQTFTATGGTGPYSFALTGTLPTGMSFASSTLSGTPTQTGSFPMTITATDANGCTGTRNYTLIINCSFTISPLSQNFTAVGGSGSVTVTTQASCAWTAISNDGWITLTGSGGTGSGSVGFTVAATAGAQRTGTATIAGQTFTVTQDAFACPSITVNPSTIPAGTTGVAYNQTITATGGTAPYGFTVSAGTLPAGLTLSSGGALSGTPTAAGTFNFTVKATDANGCTGTRAYTIVISCPSITVNPTTLPDGVAGTAYSQTVTATGGTASYAFTISAGTPPIGLTLTSGGALTGTPTAAGTYTFTIKATDANGCVGTRQYTVTICGLITVNPTNLADGVVGTSYSQTLTATGGVPSYAFTVSAGALPPGLTLAAGGGLSGTPTQAGSFSFTVTATDAQGCTGTRAYTLVVTCPTITVNPSSLPNGVIGTAYSQTVTATGGAGPYGFTLSAGTLPIGLTLASGGALAGTPSAAGTFNFTIKATDANGCIGTRAFAVVINCPSITVSPASLPAGAFNTAYSQTFTATGGTGPYSFALTGTLPTGMSFTTPTLSGTPTQTGSFPITVTAMDANGCTGNANYTLVIGCSTTTVNPASLSNGVAGTAYSQTVTASGGAAPYTFSISAGTQPTGLTLASGGALTGTPTAAGTYDFTVKATDANGCMSTRSYTVVINCPSITVNPSTLPNGVVGTAYSQTVTATGGTAPYAFTISAGTPPTGLTIASGGALTGTPTAAGTYNFTIKATDANGCMGTRAYTVIINCPSITVNPATIAAGTAGSAYSQTFTATGGTGPYNFTLTGTLPTGMSFTSPTLSGTPTQTGSFPMTITATDANGCTGTRNYTLVINCSFTISPLSQNFTAAGGSGSVTVTTQASCAWTAISNDGWITLTGSGGTGSGSVGFTVAATTGAQRTGTATIAGQTFTVTQDAFACPSVTVNPSSLPNGVAGTTYNQTLTASGGTAPYSFTVISGTQPTGMTLSSGGALSGTPTAAGTFNFTIKATDANGCAGTRAFTVTVNCPSITVNPATLPAGAFGTAYSQTFTASGGTGPFSFALTGALPTGMSFTSPSLSGTPTQTGSFPITVTATDANGCTGSANYTLVISCPSITVNPSSLPNGVVGTAYSQTVTATGGTAPYTFTISAGTQPTGLTLASGGGFTGSPTAAGTYNFTIKVTDANGCTGTRAFTVVINCPSITVNPSSLSNGTAGTTYSQTFTATGGTGPYTFAMTGTLPAGLSFTSPTLSGTPTQPGNFPITITATDANGCTGTRNYTLVINCSFTISPLSQNFTAAGGSGSVTVTTQASCAWTAISNDGWITLTGSGGTGSGSVGFTVAATAGAQRTGTATIAGQTFTVTQDAFACPSITVNPSTIPAGTTGVAYSQTFTATGGIAPYSFTITAGALPTGLSLATGGALTGTPTAAGTYNFTVKATDSNGCAGTRAYTIVISCPSITVNPTNLPNGVAGTIYNQMVTASGGTAPYSFTISAGTQPTGLTLSSGGALTGTPSAGGTYNFTVKATDGNGCIGTRAYTIIISCPSITVNPSSLPNGAFGVAFSQTFTAAGGTMPYSFALTGALPTGVSFTTPTLSGTPTQTGSFPITVTATDANGCTGSTNYTLVINCPSITVNPATLPDGVVGTAYSQTVTATGGTAPYSFTVSVGTLPTGLTLASGGALTGTPTAAGTFNFTIKATDANGCMGTRAYTVVIICPAITVNPTSLPNGAVGTAYSQTITATGGTAPYTFTISAGTQPTGLTLASGGGLTGTPTAADTFNFTVKATDANGCTGTRAYTIIINCPSVTVNPSSLPNGTIGTTYSQTFTATGGTGPYTFALTGALPAGLSFTSPTLSGTPAQPGSFPIILTTTDANGCTGTRNYTLVINCSFAISPLSQNFTAAGGNGSVTVTTQASCAWTAVSNDAWITLTGSGGTGSGSVGFTVAATGGAQRTGTATIAGQTFTVVQGAFTCPTVTVNPSSLPNGVTGTAYSQTLTASGGAAPYSFTIISGIQPTGLTLASGGALTGTPTAAGTFNFTVKATDANGCVGTRGYTVIISCPSITVSPSSLPNGVVSTAYDQTLTAAGGTAPYSFTISAGTQPTGLTLASGGGLTGTPTTAGTYNFTVRATDANGCAGTRSYTVIISGNGLVFYPLSKPVRLMDTRGGQGNCDNVSTPIAAGTSLTALARTTCEGITIPATAQAIVGNLTAINRSQQSGYLTIYPDGQTVPLASNMIYTPGQIIANKFTVGLSNQGKFNVFGERTIDVIIDISGYFAPPGSGGLYYHPLSKPIRLLDTRANQGNCDSVNSPISAGTSITTQARTTCEGLTIPQAAQAIAANATVINGTGQSGYLTIYPNGIPVPQTSNVIYSSQQTISNAFTVSLNAAGEFNMFAEKKINVIVDVAGYFSSEAIDANGPGLLFTGLARPLRILDTRSSQGNCDTVSTPITGGTSIAVPGRLTCEGITIPTTAQSLSGNVTVINQTSQSGYLTLYADGLATPLISTMVYSPNQLLANAFVVGVNSSTGQFRIFAERKLDAIVDVSGYFAP